MNFLEAVSSAFSKYAEFDGRALLSEYWYFVLFLILGDILFSIIDQLVLGAGDGLQITGLVFSLAMLLPSLAVTARRLHDVGRSAWWMLIPLTIIGIIPFLHWVISEGEARENQYGPVIS